MKCLKCNREVRDNFRSRWNHIQRFHLDIFIGTLVGTLVNEEKLFALGEYFGYIAGKAAGKIVRYGAIRKTH